MAPRRSNLNRIQLWSRRINCSRALANQWTLICGRNTMTVLCVSRRASQMYKVFLFLIKHGIWLLDSIRDYKSGVMRRTMINWIEVRTIKPSRTQSRMSRVFTKAAAVKRSFHSTSDQIMACSLTFHLKTTHLSKRASLSSGQTITTAWRTTHGIRNQKLRMC